MANPENRTIAVTLVSKGELQLPEIISKEDGEKMGFPQLLLEVHFFSELLAAKEALSAGQPGRKAASLFSNERKQIAELAAQVEAAIETISVQCKVASIESREKESREELLVRFDGFDALTIALLTDLGSMLVLEGKAEQDALAVTGLTVMETKFTAHASEAEEDGEENTASDSSEQDEEEAASESDDRDEGSQLTVDSDPSGEQLQV